MRFSVIVRKIGKRLDKLRFAPVDVLVFHAVSDCFNPQENKRVDWSQTEDFKQYILALKKDYSFISLSEAYERLRRDWFRTASGERKKGSAVLTCDDGYASVLDVLPFLEREQVPVTLFVNPKYLDGVSRREGYAEAPRYITYEQLWKLDSEWVTVGMHGYEHDDATRQSIREFEMSVERCVESLKSHPRFIPFFAYTWGRYNEGTQQTLKRRGIIPVLTDGETNYRYRQGISRRPIDSHYLRGKK